MHVDADVPAPVVKAENKAYDVPVVGQLVVVLRQLRRVEREKVFFSFGRKKRKKIFCFGFFEVSRIAFRCSDQFPAVGQRWREWTHREV
jgi:hypothetical protein